MKNRTIVIGAILIAGIVSACNSSTQSLVTGQQAKVKTAVQQFADSIATGVTHDGPIAWLKYFDHSPAFFMASDGQLVFPDQQAADKFITGTLVKSISKINLSWTNLRVDALTPEMGLIAAGFHEDITDSKGNTTSYNGYFTGIAQQTNKGWQLRDAHWSIKH
jgi:FlaG/FlaF family flagellin (archaellin)